MYNDSRPFTAPLSNGGLNVEDLSATLGFGNGWYRVVDLPFTGPSTTLFVALAVAPATPIYMERLDDLATPLEALLGLFSPAIGNVPVTVSVTDFVTFLPLSGVQIGIWSNPDRSGPAGMQSIKVISSGCVPMLSIILNPLGPSPLDPSSSPILAHFLVPTLF